MRGETRATVQLRGAHDGQRTTDRIPYDHLRARDLNHDRMAVRARVSSDEQAWAGTIEHQLDFARRYGDLHQLPIAEIYADADIGYTDMFLKAQYNAREQVEACGAVVGGVRRGAPPVWA